MQPLRVKKTSFKTLKILMTPNFWKVVYILSYIFHIKQKNKYLLVKKKKKWCNYFQFISSHWKWNINLNAFYSIYYRNNKSNTVC